MKKESLYLVIPVYNEEESITQVIEDWVSVLDFKMIPYKIIVINDGSHDRTPTILNELSRRFINVRVYNQHNQGHGKALLNGYEIAIKDDPTWIFQCDSDNQIKASEFNKLWIERNNHSVVLGKRVNRQDPLIRKVISRIVSFLSFSFFQTKINDLNCPFRMYQSSFLKRNLPSIPNDTFAPNIMLSILSNDENISIVDVNHSERKSGNASINLSNLATVCWKCFRQLMQFKVEFTKKKLGILPNSMSRSIQYESQ